MEALASIVFIQGRNPPIFLMEQDECGRLCFRGGAGDASVLGGTTGLRPPSKFFLIPIGFLSYFGVGYACVATMSIGLIAALIFAMSTWLEQSSWI